MDMESLTFPGTVDVSVPFRNTARLHLLPTCASVISSRKRPLMCVSVSSAPQTLHTAIRAVRCKSIIRRRYDANTRRGLLVDTSRVSEIMVCVFRTAAESRWEAFLSFLRRQRDRCRSRPRHPHHFTGYSISRRIMGDGAIMELMRCTRTGDTNQSGAPLSLCGHHHGRRIISGFVPLSAPEHTCTLRVFSSLRSICSK